MLFLGTLLANFVADIVRGATASAHIGNPNVFSSIARFAIIGFVALIALNQLQIAPALIQILFTAIVGALALGLAFGLGGRDSAKRLLERGEQSLNSPDFSALTSPEMNRNNYNDVYSAQTVQTAPATQVQPPVQQPPMQTPPPPPTPNTGVRGGRLANDEGYTR